MRLWSLGQVVHESLRFGALERRLVAASRRVSSLLDLGLGLEQTVVYRVLVHARIIILLFMLQPSFVLHVRRNIHDVLYVFSSSNHVFSPVRCLLVLFKLRQTILS